MTNSSDWIAALQAQTPDAAQNRSPASNWMAALIEPQGFVEGFPTLRERPAESEQTSVSIEPTVDPLLAAFERGQAEGKAAAEAQLREANAMQRELRLNFRALDAAAMDCLATELADTVVALCGQVMEDFTPEPKQLLARCQDAAQRLGDSAGEYKLHLNPADIGLIAEETRSLWNIVADETIARGGLRLVGEDGAISDGPSDWRRAIAAAIKG